MATINWPSSLPSPLLEGYKKEIVESVLRQNPDNGPPIARRRFTSGGETIVFKILIDDTQLTTLENFYYNTTNYGVELFNFTDPLTNTNKECQFIAPPSYEVVSQNQIKATIQVRAR